MYRNLQRVDLTVTSRSVIVFFFFYYALLPAPFRLLTIVNWKH